MKSTTTQRQRATLPALTLDTAPVLGCSPLPGDAPHYVSQNTVVKTSSEISRQRYNYVEWTIARERFGVPLETDEGYVITIAITFANGNADCPDRVVYVCGEEADTVHGFSTADFRRFVAALNAAAAALPATAPGLLLPEASR